MANNDPKGTCVSTISKAFFRAEKMAKSSSRATASTARSSSLLLKSTIKPPCPQSAALVVPAVVQDLLAAQLPTLTVALLVLPEVKVVPAARADLDLLQNR